MKRFLIIITCCLFIATSSLSAQNHTQDVVYLKNGSIIKGVIIEHIPYESIEIETADGSIFFYDYEEVERIRKESVSSKQPQQWKEEPNNIARYRGFIDLGYSTQGYFECYELTTSHGIQINQRFFFGIGIGVHYFDEDDITLPFFLDARAAILKGAVSPTFGLRVGCTFDSNSFDANLYYTPSLGIRYKTKKNLALNLSVGYSAQTTSSYYMGVPQNEKCAGINLKFGIEF